MVLTLQNNFIFTLTFSVTIRVTFSLTLRDSPLFTRIHFLYPTFSIRGTKMLLWFTIRVTFRVSQGHYQGHSKGHYQGHSKGPLSGSALRGTITLRGQSQGHYHSQGQSQGHFQGHFQGPVQSTGTKLITLGLNTHTGTHRHTRVQFFYH